MWVLLHTQHRFQPVCPYRMLTMRLSPVSPHPPDSTHASLSLSHPHPLRAALSPHHLFALCLPLCHPHPRLALRLPLCPPHPRWRCACPPVPPGPLSLLHPDCKPALLFLCLTHCPTPVLLSLCLPLCPLHPFLTLRFCLVPSYDRVSSLCPAYPRCCLPVATAEDCGQ